MQQLVTVVLVLIALSHSIAHADPISLDRFIKQAIDENPSLSASKLSANAERQRVLSAFALDDPFFAAGVDDVPFNEIGAGLVRYQLSFTIPFPGKLAARGRIAESQADAKTADAETARRELVVMATQTYYRACFNQRAIDLNRDTYGFISNLTQSAKSRYKTGNGSHHEWIQAKIELSILDIENLRLQREKKIVQTLMNELRNQAPATPFDLVIVDFDQKQTGIQDIEVLLETQPELLSITAKQKAAAAKQDLEHSSYFPDLVVQGMAMHPYGSMDEPAKFGLMGGITLPLFFFQKQSPMYKAASTEFKALTQRKQALQNSLQSEINTANLELATAKDIVQLYQKEVIPLTELAVENTKLGYVARRAPLSQLVEDLRVKRIQRLELYAAQIDEDLAKLRITELLSSPPTLRFAPLRPTTIGGSMQAPGMTTGMGRGLRSAPPQSSTPSETAPTESMTRM